MTQEALPLAQHVVVKEQDASLLSLPVEEGGNGATRAQSERLADEKELNADEDGENSS